MRFCRVIGALLALLAHAPVYGQDDIVIPAVGRPSRDFYNAAGTAVKVRWDAKPTELSTDEWLTLTLTVSGLQNPAALTAPDLRDLTEFQDSFQIEVLKEPKANAPDQRTFAFRLRPVRTDVTSIPALRFYYFNPRVPENLDQLRFQFTTAASLPLKVRPKSSRPRTVIALEVPGFAEELATGQGVLQSSENGICQFLLILFLILCPVIAAWWVVVWKNRYPDAARQARLRQSRAARRALTELERLRRRSVAEPGTAVAETLLRYLHERVDVPPWARTPADVADQLGRSGIGSETVVAVRGVLQKCDAARFAPAMQHDLDPVIIEAERVIQSMERVS